MTSEEVRAVIRNHVISHFHLRRVGDLGDEDSLLESGLIDSLGILELVEYLEKTFGIALVDGDLSPENFDSIAALTRFVGTKIRP